MMPEPMQPFGQNNEGAEDEAVRRSHPQKIGDFRKPTPPAEAPRAATTPAAEAKSDEAAPAEQPAQPGQAGEPEYAQAFSSDDMAAVEAVGKSAPLGPGGVPRRSGLVSGRALRRQLDDDDLDAELAAAMGNFDKQQVLTVPPKAPKVHDIAGVPGQGAAPPVAGRDKGRPQGPAGQGRRGDRQAKDQAEANPRRMVRVLDVRGPDIFVDLGEKAEGIVAALQFGAEVPKPGDQIEVMVDHYDNANDVYILRRPGVSQEADWSSVHKGSIVDVQVKKVNKGGLEVAASGIRGFMPAGQVSLEHIADLSVFLNQTMRAEITEVDRSAKNLIVSRKAVLLRERAEQAAITFASLEEGQVREGTVRKLMDFGAFVDIGGVDGLLHIGQMAWHRLKHPSEMLIEGQKIPVIILNIDRETKKIGLGSRQLTESPWIQAELTYTPGAIVDGTVSRLADFGAFVELEPAIEGLIHISELASKHVQRASQVVQVGERITVKVLAFDKENRRIGLSLKQALAPPPEPEAKKPAEAAPAAAAAGTTANGIPVTPPTEEPPPVKKKPIGPLKGGLGGSGGPLFG